MNVHAPTEDKIYDKRTGSTVMPQIYLCNMGGHRQYVLGMLKAKYADTGSVL
jgi:hypothetical protein